MIKLTKNCLLMFLLIVLSEPILSQTYFSARLTRQQIPGKTDTTIIGTNNSGPIGTAVFILGGQNNTGPGQTGGAVDNTLRFIITVGNLGNRDTASGGGDTTKGGTSGMLRSIHFNIGAIGDTGRVVRTITQGIRGNTFSGSWAEGDIEPFSGDIRNQLAMGRVYVVAVTDSGEIRGQIHPASGTGFVSMLTGPQEPDSVATKASGIASLLLTDLGLIYHISVQGMTVTGASINRGDPGMNGPMLHSITFNGNTAFGIWAATSSGTDTLGITLQKVLLAEGLYINVQSQKYSSGEIRGQILHAGGLSFSSPLRSTRRDSTGQTGADSTRRRLNGNASYTLTDHGLVYHINLSTRGQMATVFFAEEATNQRIKDIPGFADSSISNTWLTNEPNTPLTDQRVADLLQGRLSLVAVAGTDTLRGRIMPHKQTNFTAVITGPQERPRKMSKATGIGHFILTDQGLNYYITLAGIDTITAAHFHMAPMGVSGGVVMPITFDSTHTASGTWSRTGNNALTDNMIDALLRGDIYVNVHTPSHPEGEIRGQLVHAAGTDFKAELVGRATGGLTTGQQTTKGNGTANFMLANEGLVYMLTMDSVKITGIDFVRGAVGESGRVINTTTVNADSNTIIGVWRRTGGGTQTLADSLVAPLLTGDMYVIVHTSDNTTTIRGQVLPNGGWGFVSVFNPQGAAGASTAFQNANGNAVFTLTDAGLKYDIAAEGFRDNTAGIYAGQAGGQSGNQVHQLTSNFAGGTSKGAWLMVNDSAAAMANLPVLFSNGLFLKLSAVDTANTGRFSAQITRNFEIPVVSVENTKSVPRTFALEQNYPNPFNPSTTIRFSIPENGNVELIIYNIIGEKVATLINGQNYKAGSYQINFDGSRLASGVYFYRLSFGTNMTTRKMLLLK